MSSPGASNKRFQARDTTTSGDPVPDNNWNIIYDSGPIGGNPPPPPPPPPPTCPPGEHWDAATNQCIKDVVNPPPPPPVTTGQLKITAVKSSCVDAANPPENAIDGNPNTRWRCLGIGSWLQLDLGQASDISEVDIMWHDGGNRAFNYVIQTSTEGHIFANFTQGTSTGKTAAAEKYSGTANARFVKIIVNGNTVNQYASIQEISVYGKAGSVNPPPPPPRTCPPGETWDPVLKQCVNNQNPVCPPGEHWDTTLNQCVKDVVTPPPPGGKVDVFGIQKIYDDAAQPVNNWSLTSANDPRFFEQTPQGPDAQGYYTYPNNTQGRIEVLSDTAATESSIPTFDVAQVIDKGYLWKPIDSADGKGDFGNVEVTVRYADVTLSSGSFESHPEIAAGGLRQTNDSKTVGGGVPASCEAMSYHFNWYSQSHRLKFEKDSQHTSGYTVNGSDPATTSATQPFENKPDPGVIHKGILYRVPDASIRGGYAMKLEQWVDETGSGKSFKKVLETLDNGSWGPTQGGNSACNCPAPKAGSSGDFVVLNMARVAIGIRIDFMNTFKWKDWSIRSIDSAKRLV